MVRKNHIIKMLLGILMLFWINLLARDVFAQINFIEERSLLSSKIYMQSIKDFNISLYPEEIRLHQGQASSVKVNIFILGDLKVELSVENCPFDIVCQLNQTEFYGSGLAILKIITTSNTPPGTYNITIKGKDNRSIIKTKNLRLRVIKVSDPIIPPPIIDPEPILLPPVFDFNISVFPNFVSLIRGSSKTVNIAVNITGDVTVHLDIEGCPANSICQLNQTEFNKSGVAKLTIFSNDSAGTYEIHIVGKAKNVIKTKNLTLKVNDYELGYPDSIVTVPGVSFVIQVYGIKHGDIEKVELNIECNYGISCIILGWFDNPLPSLDKVWYIGIRVPANISKGIYPIKLKLLLDYVEREYIMYLDVRLPEELYRLEYIPYTRIRKLVNYNRLKI
ncbi:MAG: hypothetical protein QW483_01790 [Nanopusillaceae archaeon]